jgi:hypothetical protein
VSRPLCNAVLRHPNWSLWTKLIGRVRALSAYGGFGLGCRNMKQFLAVLIVFVHLTNTLLPCESALSGSACCQAVLWH